MRKWISYFSLLLLSALPGPMLAYTAPKVSINKSDPGSVAAIINSVIDWFLKFAGAVVVLFIIFGGLQYIVASGNEKQAEKAKKTLTYAVIGLIIIILAEFIVSLVLHTTSTILKK